MTLWRKPKPAITVTKAILVAAAPTVPVSSTQPERRPDRYVVLGVLSGDYPNPAVTEPRVKVDCYAKTILAAGDLADEAIAALLNARGLFAGAWVKKFANPKGPYRLDKPGITDRYRFQFHGELRLSTR